MNPENEDEPRALDSRPESRVEPTDNVEPGMTATGPATRRSFVFNGRRLRLADLLKADLIKPGDSLTYHRPRLNETHKATVTPSGSLRCGDRDFPAPSSAAAYFSGSSIDGWTAWKHDASGKFLDSLRQQLLDDEANEPIEASADDSGEAASETEDLSAARRAFLKECRREADEGTPRQAPVIEILRLWGIEKRTGESLHALEADLGNYSLSTTPDIRYVPLDSTVKIVLQSEITQSDGSPQPSSHPAFAAERDEDEEAGDEIAQTVGQIASRLTSHGRVSPDAPLDEAATKMILNDYSQLAVTQGDRNLKGAITWQSIARASLKGSPKFVRDAMIKNPTVVSYDHHLVEAIPELSRSGFFFVRYGDNTYRIITTADIAGRYGELATPFLLIGELDKELRRRIKTLPLADVKAVCDSEGDRGISEFDDLSFGDYEMICKNPTLWKQLGWSLDRKTVGERLGGIREFRNDVMHFNPDSPDEDYLTMIKNLLDALRE